jgi:dipicolinate synthase subunit A
MLTGRKLVFIGGDARQIEVIAEATELDASATLIGFEKLTKNFTDTTVSELTTEVLSEADAIVLPVAGMDDDGRVDSQFSDSPVWLTADHFAALKPGTFVFSGIARPQLEKWCQTYNLRLIKLMELDEVAILNSIPTAEGAIALAMQHTDITIHGSNAVVLGFGRCGMTLARSLHGLGANVRVGARYSSDIARIREMGIEPIRLSSLETSLQSANIIFNTIPKLIMTAAVLAHVPREAVIIDIASKPGGTDFRYAERHGIKALLAPSLPGLVAPKTAGRIIGDTLCRILAEELEIE